MKNNITIYDVAELAGVSQSTVSKVLNNYPNISKDTRSKVREAEKKLNFNPDPYARGLAGKREKNIGLIVDDITNPFYSQAAQYILDEAKLLDYNIIISDAYDEPIYDAINRLIYQRVDGILISAVKRDLKIDEDKIQRKIPLVFFNQKPDNEKVNRIILDDKLGAEKAIQYLYKNGHRKIGFISGDLQRSTYNARLQGYIKSMNKYGLEIIDDFVFIGDEYLENVKSFLEKGQKANTLPTSIFAASDAIAIDLIGTLHHLGLNVPEDLSIIGFGDVDISSHPLINLTTISQNIKSMSLNALDIVINIIESDEITESILKEIIIKPSLIIRGTVSKNKKR